MSVFLGIPEGVQTYHEQTDMVTCNGVVERDEEVKIAEKISALFKMVSTSDGGPGLRNQSTDLRFSQR